MRKRWVPLLCFMMVVLTILACEGATSGSVTGSTETCRMTGNGGECEGKFGKLSGTYGADIEDENIFSMDVIDVEVQVSVESGSVKVSVEGRDGEVSSVQATPNQPATLVGVTEGDFDGFEVTFEALDEEARNVQYKISYQIR